MQRIVVKNATYQQIKAKNNYTISGSFDPYTGNYHVTPSNVTQTLLTKGKGMTKDVIIDPIPKSYGLITYNGFELTVS